MKIKHLHIQNYKSLVDLKIVEPNAFSVFAGPNGAGKSNVFEALQFANTIFKFGFETIPIFGGKEKIYSYMPKPINYNTVEPQLNVNQAFHFEFDENIGLNFGITFPVNTSSFLLHESAPTIHFRQFYNDQINYCLGPLEVRNPEKRKEFIKSLEKQNIKYNSEYEHFVDNFHRIFIGESDFNRLPSYENRISMDASNIEKILKIILSVKDKREDFFEWLALFIPGFDNIQITSDSIETNQLLIFEKGTQKPFDKKLISDGTYNILALLAAVYQSNEPQFLCIEEPENGLNPYVIKTLVDFFRKQCEEKGHYIWLNTHSQTLVKELQPNELILVDKMNGATQIKQFSKDYNLHGLTMDEAWLSNALGGGLPW